MEGDPDRAREVHLPGLREDQPAAGAVPSDAARLGRAEPAGDDPLREVRPAPAAEPPGRALRPGGRRSEPLDAGRPGRRLRRGAGAAARADRGPCPGRRAAARRRHHRAGAGQGQDRHRPALDLCPRRPPLRRSGARPRRSSTSRPTGGASIPNGISPAGKASSRPMPMPATTTSIAPTAQPGPITERALLGPCAAQVLRAGRHRRQRPQGQDSRRRSRPSRSRP